MEKKSYPEDDLREVLSNVPNTMLAFYCAETSKTAMDFCGNPEIFNSDQGSPFTSWGAAELGVYASESAWMGGAMFGSCKDRGFPADVAI